MNEQLRHDEALTAPEIKVNLLQSPKTTNTESQPNRNEQLNIQKIREKLLEQPSIPLELPMDENPQGVQLEYIDHKIKSLTLKKELKNIQNNLTVSQKALSMVIHQPLVKKTSEIGAKTISRPIGLLGGGVCAFIGSLVYLGLDKYIGLKYNYLFFILFFLFGYIFATLLEFISKPFIKSKS